jgi:hypothetical protein
MELRGLLTVATVGAVSLAAASPLAAAPLLPNHPAPAAATQSATELQQVQYRYGRGGYGYRHGYYGHRRHYGAGAAALGGLAAGAIIGGAIANSQAEAANSQAYCAQRFRSYDPGSGTYLGSDGLRHSCP